ncbi:hypothetical protein [Streptomyces sp. NPDC020681]|uniref:hypothetical protein n=1 Tax=Streptomyces sp. NPDC020681 TaxID=3365083 RepID=UPI00378B67FB
MALALAAACSSGDDGDGRGEDKAPKTVTGTLEQIAAQAECKPNIQTDAKELRQANCTTGDGKYVLATFATDRGQREWINEANDYGGSYLVGRKWVAVGDEKVVTALRARLGGTVETGTQHTSGGTEGHEGHTASPTASHTGDHSGHTDDHSGH